MLVGILAVLISGFIVLEKKGGGASLSFHEATRLLNTEQAILIDLRDDKEFKAGHIVDALHIPYAKLADRESELNKHKTKTIILVDKMGQHAGAAGKTLKEKGYTVARLQGGMVEWQGQNLPVVKS